MKHMFIAILFLNFFSCAAMHISRVAHAPQKQKNSFSFPPMQKSTLRSIAKKISIHEISKSASPQYHLYKLSAQIGIGHGFKKDASKSVNNSREELADRVATICFGLGALILLPTAVVGVGGGAAVLTYGIIEGDMYTRMAIVGTGITSFAVGVGVLHCFGKE